MVVRPLTDEDLASRRELATRSDVELLVRSFHRDAAMDELLGPIFSAAHVNWDAHIATLTDFWVSQVLGERGYVVHPLRAHEPVHARTPFGPRSGTPTTNGGSTSSSARSTSISSGTTPSRRRAAPPRWRQHCAGS